MLLPLLYRIRRDAVSYLPSTKNSWLQLTRTYTQVVDENSSAVSLRADDDDALGHSLWLHRLDSALPVPFASNASAGSCPAFFFITLEHRSCA